MRITTLLVLSVVFLAAGFINPASGFSFGLFSRYTSVNAANGEVRIAVSDVDDGKAHYYSYDEGQRTINFFVVKSSDGIVRAAFDACDVCFSSRKGYTQEGDFMICNNCGRKFHTARINVVEGGCNPAPLNRTTADGQLVIRVSDILSGARFF